MQGANDSRTLYQRSVEAIQVYSSHNRGRVEKETEEEQFRDLLLLMELLTNLLSKDLIDLAPQEESSSGNSSVSAAEVCLFGLNIVMPLMTLELLKFPSLCLQYFRTITLVCEIFPEKVGVGKERARSKSGANLFCVHAGLQYRPLLLQFFCRNQPPRRNSSSG